MEIRINGRQLSVPSGTRLFEARDRFSPAADVWIVNGYHALEDLCLQPGDEVSFIQRGQMPDRSSLKAMMYARHTPGVQQKVENSCIGIAGLGGLGSSIAIMLARVGVGSLVLVDFDVVEPSNLNRQQYAIKHLGMLKTQALAEQIQQINPYLCIRTHPVRLTAENAAEIFQSCGIVCEALDRPEQKATLVETLLCRLPQVKIVASSGMAGYGSANSIRTRKAFENLYICGDGQTESCPGTGLMAPRVMVAAAHQANMALRLALGLQEV